MKGLGVVALVVLVLSPGWAEAQSKLQQARQAYMECRELLQTSRACEAAKRCEEGIAIKSLDVLEELRDDARAACKLEKKGQKARKKRPKPCPTGMLRTDDTAGRCCWPGQVWAENERRCFGKPTECPPELEANAHTCRAVQPPCDDEGRVQVEPDPQACCWPGQRWSSTQQRCIGAPVCPEMQIAVGEDCDFADTDDDGLLDRDENPLCRLLPEDMDGFEDDDGCPEVDNDADGICDPQSWDPELLAAVNVGCSTEMADFCPETPEDLDGFEDSDGCPDLDNDGDGLPDTEDRCPDEAEDFDGFEDGDGCLDTDEPPPDLAPYGWASLGVGSAFLVTGVVSSVVASTLRADVLEAETTARGYIRSITQREAQDNEVLANTLSQVALASYIVGGTLVTASVVLLLLNEAPDDEDPMLGASLGEDGAVLWWRQRF